MNRLFFLPCVLLFILITLVSETRGQVSGELVEIDYPRSITAGEPLPVRMTVKNTGPGTWKDVCAYVGYLLQDVPFLTTCSNLGPLEPGNSATYSCSTETGIPETPERIWAGVGSPFG